MMNVILVIYYVMWYMVIFLACLFSVSALDDFFIDLYFWLYFWPKQKPSTHLWRDFQTKPEQYIAVMIPCWHESKVITQMLINSIFTIDYNRYYLFVGVYPNDPNTVLAVTQVAQAHHHVQCVIGDTPGPTNKAANLNQIYRHALEFEKQLPQPFEIFVFHDSEDIIHPLSFTVYNHYVPDHDMVQIPIFPLEIDYWRFTHWLYADEFSENHTKDIFVRQSIKAHIPSAGVGTAFSRHALRILADEQSGMPFSTESLTEDYRTSLSIRLKQLKPLFAGHEVWRTKWVKHGLWGQKHVLKRVKERIATRAFFPMEYTKAVRQKARWIIGIVFQEWDNSLWPRGWRVRYTLLHDRKAFITHFINVFGYIVFLFWLIYSWFSYNQADYPSLQEQLNLHPWVYWLMWFVFAMMIERYMQRICSTWRVYGWRPLLLLIPRVFYGNLLNFHALLRAYRIYFTLPEKDSKHQTLVWDKTEHDFPGCHPLIPYRRRLSNLLVEEGYVTLTQLQAVCQQREQTGERLGEILCRLSYLNPKTLQSLLAKQYNLALIQRDNCLDINQYPMSRHLPKKVRHILRQQKLFLVDMNSDEKRVTLAIFDPTNELLLKQILHYLAKYQVIFMLLDM